MRRATRFLALLAPAVVVIGLAKIHASVLANPPYDFTGSFRFAWSLGYIFVLCMAIYGLGLPDVPRTMRQAFTSVVVASLTAAVILSVVQLVLGDALLPRFVVFGSALALLPVQYGLWMLARGGRRHDEGRDRVFLVAAVDEGSRLAEDLQISPERNAMLVACIEPEQVQSEALEGRSLVDKVRAVGATVVVIDRLARSDHEVISQAAELHESGIRVRTLLQFYEEWLGKLPAAELERASLFFDIAELHQIRYGRLKRMLDVGGALAGLVALAVTTPLVVAVNLFANRGPLLYRQERVGRNGTHFEILKFRTMRPTDSMAGGSDWTSVDDVRITPFGSLLRRTHLDELPQVINILRGDLSVVGPRPEQPRYVAELSEKLPFYNMRHLVRPGLTGWAQVKYGYAGDETDALEKLQYEFYYLRHQGLRFDLRVIGRTVRSIIGGQGSGR